MQFLNFKQGDQQGKGELVAVWLRSPDGMPMQLLVADKVSPSDKTPKSPARPPARRDAAAQARSQSAQIFPRWLSHVLLFTPDVPAMLRFCGEVPGLRLSDRSGDLVAFMHTPHGSDHRLLAFVKSSHPGLHHTSWDVGSLDEVDEGSEADGKANTAQQSSAAGRLLCCVSWLKFQEK